MTHENRQRVASDRTLGLSLKTLGLTLVALIGMAMASGCAVPQPRGEGLYRHVREPTTGAYYHLYLPVDYVRNRGRHPNYPKIKKWPLVMTFHGMKPYDNAHPQEREWEKEADIYGYIVCAPELNTSDSFMEYPLTKEHSYVLRDRQNVIAIMDHVFKTTAADPERVLATSWSCGGYLANYFVNRYPDRFACLAPRLSNFSGELLIEDTIPQYKDRIPVAMFIGDGDFPACKRESMDAVAWYMARGFKTVRGKMIDHMGHQRIPQTAAAFFAEQLGIEPLRPIEASTTLSRIQMVEYQPSPERIAQMAAVSQTQRERGSTPTTAVAAAAPEEPAKATPRSTPRGKSPRAPRGPIPVVATAAKAVYVCSNAGGDYPLDRPPLYNPNPTTPPRPRSTSSGRPATAADSTRVAQSSPERNQQTTFLDPVNPNPRLKEKPASAEKPTTDESKTPEPNPTAPSPTERRTTRRTPERPAVTSRHIPRRATRHQSGPYHSTPPSQPKTAESSPTSASTTGRVQLTSAKPRAKRVDIQLNGPAVGTKPYYLNYSTSLPRSKTAGADFLWMDNGVWIGDDPDGVKVLQTPGLHRITVLIITKDNEEYRGAATVQVLEKGQ